jgi:transcriptional regulator with XRE-family HTH domain
LKPRRSPAHRHLRELLVAARKKAGLTQEQLARHLGKSQSFIAKYEGGERRIDVIEFITIAAALGMPAERAIREVRLAALTGGGYWRK